MIVDLNRQSLDRVVPGIRVRRVENMFAAAGWHVDRGQVRPRDSRSASRCPGGETLRERIDDMGNEDYQS